MTTHLKHARYAEPYMGITASSRAELAAAVSRVAGLIGNCEIIEDGVPVGRVILSWRPTNPAYSEYTGAVILRYSDNRQGQPYLWLADRSVSRCLNLAD